MLQRMVAVSAQVQQSKCQQDDPHQSKPTRSIGGEAPEPGKRLFSVAVAWFSAQNFSSEPVGLL